MVTFLTSSLHYTMTLTSQRNEESVYSWITLLFQESLELPPPPKKKHIYENLYQYINLSIPVKGIWPLNVKDDREGGDHLKVGDHNFESHYEGILPFLYELVNPVKTITCLIDWLIERSDRLMTDTMHGQIVSWQIRCTVRSQQPILSICKRFLFQAWRFGMSTFIYTTISISIVVLYQIKPN